LIIAMAAMLSQAGAVQPRPAVGSDEWVARMEDAIRKAEAAPTTGDRLQGGLVRLHGKPPAQAFRLLGPPDSKMIDNGTTIYRWINVAPIGLGRPGTVRCQVAITVRQNVVTNSSFRGQNGACEGFVTALESSAH
jgi:hypothetical protein